MLALKRKAATIYGYKELINLELYDDFGSFKQTSILLKHSCHREDPATKIELSIVTLSPTLRYRAIKRLLRDAEYLLQIIGLRISDRSAFELHCLCIRYVPQTDTFQILAISTMNNITPIFTKNMGPTK